MFISRFYVKGLKYLEPIMQLQKHWTGIDEQKSNLTQILSKPGQFESFRDKGSTIEKPHIYIAM